MGRASARRSSRGHFAGGSLRVSVALAAAGTLLAALPAAPARADRPVPSYKAETLNSPEPQAAAFFGNHVDAVGDLNGDGVKDFAVSSERQNSGAVPRIGVVWIFSGRTRDVIRTLQNPDPQPNTGFGDSILGIGDVSGDGVPDVVTAGAALDVYTGTGTACGTPEPNGCNERQGRVYVFSGRTGSLIRRIEDPTPHEFAFFGYGHAVGPGDLNGDGVPDFVVTSFEDIDVLCDDDQDPATPPAKPCPGVGAAYAFSGKDGSLIYRLDDPDPEGYADFGDGASSPGDVTGDGVGDIFIGAAFSSGGGHAYLFSGKTGALVRKFVNPDPDVDPTGGGFGFGVGHGIEPGDVNGDGVPDLIVAAPGHRAGSVSNAGRLYLLSGKDGSLIRILNDPNPKTSGSLGFNNASAGDVNGDGTPDILASRFIFPPGAYAPDPPPGAAAYVFDGKTGAPLVTLPGMSQDGPGNELVSPGDLNGDGYPDYVLGGRLLDGGAGNQSGQVIVELSQAPPAAPSPPSETLGPPGGSTPPTSPGGSDQPPLIVLGGPRIQRLGSLYVSVLSNKDAALTAGGTITPPRTNAAKTYRLRTTRANAKARTTVKLRLKLSAKAARAIKRTLRRGRRATARITITATDKGGRKRTAQRKIKVVR